MKSAMISTLTALLSLVLLLPVPAVADSLPDSPVRLISPGREFRVETGILAAAWTADAASTRDLFNRCPACIEAGGLYNGSRAVPKIMGAWAAVDVAAAAAAYEWKEHVHNRWLHPLWRVPLALQVGGHTQAAFHNYRLR